MCTTPLSRRIPGLVAVAFAIALVGPGPLSAQEAGLSCVGLSPPVPGEVIEPYAPVGQYEGHWGIDLAAAPGSAVDAAGAGRVTFSGVVAGNRTVTLDHGGGLRTSYSYLSESAVSEGQWIGRGDRIGLSGLAHDTEAVHWSVRLGEAYQDPAGLVGCRASGPGGAVYLVSAS